MYGIDKRRVFTAFLRRSNTSEIFALVGSLAAILTIFAVGFAISLLFDAHAVWTLIWVEQSAAHVTQACAFIDLTFLVVNPWPTDAILTPEVVRDGRTFLRLTYRRGLTDLLHLQRIAVKFNALVNALGTEATPAPDRL